jgi:predicted amidophosphoribosyltransferase
MVFVAISDGVFSNSEKPEILSFAKTIKISQDQIKQIFSEAKGRITLEKRPLSCSSCGKELPPESNFCTQCGAGIQGR